MKSYHISKPDAAIEDVVLRTHDMPRPSPREVLIRVRASSLNYRDLLMLKGYRAGAIKPDLIPLSCGAGEVVEIGAEVTRIKVGDHVGAIFRQNWIDGASPAVVFDADLGSALDGMLSEYRVFSEEGIVLVPRHLSFEQAATLPCAGVTAWSAITDPVPVKPGETVLIEGTGGVSLFALQFARLCGARVIATSSSEEKLARLKTLGADEVINYATNPDWDKVVLDLTNGIGVDRVVEVGGGDTLEKALNATRVGGRLSLVGVLSGQTKPSMVAIISRYLSVHGVAIGSRAHFEAMNRAMSTSLLAPVIDRVFGFDEVHAAYRHLKGRSHFGKVVIKHD